MSPLSLVLPFSKLNPHKKEQKTAPHGKQAWIITRYHWTAASQTGFHGSKDSVEMNQCYPSLNYPIISNCRVKMLQLQCKWLQPWPRGGNHRLHDNNNVNSNSNNKERKNNKYSYRYRMIQDIHTFKIIQILEIKWIRKPKGGVSSVYPSPPALYETAPSRRVRKAVFLTSALPFSSDASSSSSPG